MTGGQTALVLGEVTELHVSVSREPAFAARPRGVLRVVRATDEELVAHERMLEIVDKASGGKTVWRSEAISRWRLADSSESSNEAAAAAYA
jgi:DNA polymerase-3 subunit epsilon